MEKPAPKPQTPRDITPRAILIGFVSLSIVCIWIHYAELVREAGQLAATSIPMGAFSALFVIVAVNLVLRKSRWFNGLRQTELLTIYVMLTTGTVVASSGGIHFLVPRLAAPFYAQWATKESKWPELFHKYIPTWIAPRDPKVIDGFFLGHSSVPWGAWLIPAIVWISVLIVFLFVCLCIVSLLQHQWIKEERLTFPTLILPLEITRDEPVIFRSGLLWIGFAVSFGIAALNMLQANFPNLPTINVHGFDPGTFITEGPLSGMGIPMEFLPFVIGIGYLIPLDTTLSVWFFYLAIRVERIFGVMMGWYSGSGGDILGRFPLNEYQGAGAFIGLALFSLWRGRHYFKQAFSHAFSRKAKVDDSQSALPIRVAVFGLIGGFLALIGFTMAAGSSMRVPAAYLILVLLFVITAARVRAETGAAWLMGTGIHPYTVLITLAGTKSMGAPDQAVMAFFGVLCMHELRTLSMPHQLDGMKLADSAGISRRRMIWVMLFAGAVGTIVAFWTGLWVWYKYGALVKTDAWRTMIGGKQGFDQLASNLTTPGDRDVGGSLFIFIGVLFTIFLGYMRAQFAWFPFHPVGYVVANTRHWAVAGLWFPFFIAWLAKLIILRLGGMSLYRRLMPFFLGLILGDFVAAGGIALFGCLVNGNIYSVLF